MARLIDKGDFETFYKLIILNRKFDLNTKFPFDSFKETTLLHLAVLSGKYCSLTLVRIMAHDSLPVDELSENDDKRLE